MPAIAIVGNDGSGKTSVVEYLRKKGIAKASKKMSRTATEGLALVKEENGKISIIEINSETDFVAKNKDFINFCKEVSELNFENKGDLVKTQKTWMKKFSLNSCLNTVNIKDAEVFSGTISKYLRSNI